ncbi:MAG: RidA family protein [Bryobacterales bacterium]|nr:RidA family protein [Bryobacterales bacterium]
MKTSISLFCLVLAHAAVSMAGVRAVGSGPVAGTAGAVVVTNEALAHTAQILPLRRDGGPVESGGARTQADRVLRRLDQVLRDAGSRLNQTVKLNVYVRNAEVVPEVTEAINRRIGGATRDMAISFVAGALPHPDALVAMDAVATALREPPLRRHVAFLPKGPRIYISGQAVRGEIRDSTSATLTALKNTMDYLGVRHKDVVQVKVFLNPMSSAPQVAEQISEAFTGYPPPVVFVEWISGTPVEIEMIAASPQSEGPGIEYLGLPGMTDSPVYSRVTRLRDTTTIYTSGLYGTAGAPGETQIREIFASLKQLMEQAGSDLLHLAKATYYVTEDGVSQKLNDLRPEYYDPKRPPAASKAMVPGTGFAGRTITLDMIAVPATSPPSPGRP